MNKKLALLLGLGLALFALRQRQDRPRDPKADPERAWQQEADLLGLPRTAPHGPCGEWRDEQGRLVVSTSWGYVALEPGESPGDPAVLQRAQDEAKRREVNRFYEKIAQEREKRIPPGSRLKRDRWGFLYEKNPHGLGWREFGADPDEPYELKINSSW